MKAAEMIVIDPALQTSHFDHHHSFAIELANTATELHIPYKIFASERSQADSVPCLPQHILPHFGIDTYYSFDSFQDYQDREQEIFRQARDEYESIPVPENSHILMHTSSPWHLHALSSWLSGKNFRRLAIGLMLAPSSWTKDPYLQIYLDRLTWRAIDALNPHSLFLYSETGRAFRGTRTVTVPTLVSPLSRKSLDLTLELSKKAPSDRILSRTVTFGFFGGGYEHKGISLIRQAARELESTHSKSIKFKFFLTPKFRSLADSLNAEHANIHAQALPLSNAEFFRAMSSVDVVLCCYDPGFYVNQMSGIVTEAAVLGRAVITSKGSAPTEFLQLNFPGTSIAIEYGLDNLLAALKLPRHTWRKAITESRKSVTRAAELKAGHRFLESALGLN